MEHVDERGGTRFIETGATRALFKRIAGKVSMSLPSGRF
jgi:hypothetical protein